MSQSHNINEVAQETPRLSVYNSDYELEISADGKLVSTADSPGFALLNKQARMNYGVKSGKFMFEVKIIKFKEPKTFTGFNAHAKNTFINQCMLAAGETSLVRVGWATQFAPISSSLGVDHQSCCYESSGTRFYTGNFKKYGEPFCEGDVIRCCIDIEGISSKSFSYYKNGYFQGIAYRISSRQVIKAFYPAINIRNAEVQFNFDQTTELCPVITTLPAHVSPTKVIADSLKAINIPNAQNLVSKEEIKVQEYLFVGQSKPTIREYAKLWQPSNAEAVLLVGLPGTGKTTFAEAYAKRNPQVVVLGTHQIYEQISQATTHSHLQANLPMVMEITTEIMDKCMKRLALLGQRSVVIDQCNVLLKARIKKLQLFRRWFHVKAFIFVLSDAEQRKRLVKREMKWHPTARVAISKLPAEAVRNLKENFVLPSLAEGFDDIQYIEIEEKTARCIVLMNNLLAKKETHSLLRKVDFARVLAAKLALQAAQVEQVDLKSKYQDFVKEQEAPDEETSDHRPNEEIQEEEEQQEGEEEQNPHHSQEEESPHQFEGGNQQEDDQHRQQWREEEEEEGHHSQQEHYQEQHEGQHHHIEQEYEQDQNDQLEKLEHEEQEQQDEHLNTEMNQQAQLDPIQPSE